PAPPPPPRPLPVVPPSLFPPPSHYGRRSLYDRPSRSLRPPRPDRSFRCGRDRTLRRGAVRCHSGCSRLDARPHPLRRTTRGRRRARPIPDVPRSSTLGRAQSRGEDNPCCTVVEMITAAAATRRSTTDLSTVRQAGGPV